MTDCIKHNVQIFADNGEMVFVCKKCNKTVFFIYQDDEELIVEWSDDLFAHTNTS